MHDDSREFQLRQAIHTTLHAISTSAQLRPIMLIKGGILLAILYGSSRYTRDIDFSTTQLHKDFDEENFLDELETQLANSVEILDYKLDCRVQSKKLKPREGATYPTLEIGIGHAYFGTKQHKQLANQKSSTVLRIDYSFNEIQLFAPVEIKLNEADVVCAYSLPDLIGEKYRALLQQEIRKRVRSQDVFDIHMLLTNPSLAIEPDTGLRTEVLLSLIEKSNSRHILVNRLSMRDEKLKNRAKSEYHYLGETISDTLPDFDEAYERVKNYYESLPWP